jgi:hypothetical protein
LIIISVGLNAMRFLDLLALHSKFECWERARDIPNHDRGARHAINILLSAFCLRCCWMMERLNAAQKTVGDFANRVKFEEYSTLSSPLRLYFRSPLFRLFHTADLDMWIYSYNIHRSVSCWRTIRSTLA